MTEKPLRRTLAASCLVHAAAYGWTINVSRTVEVRSTARAAPDAEIALEEDVPAAAALPDGHRQTEAATEAARAAAAATKPSAQQREPEPQANEGTADTPMRSTDDGSWTFSPTTGTAGPTGLFAGRALDVAVRAGVRAALAQERAERSTHDGRIVIRLPPFGPRDIELGLAPGGSLASIARDLVRWSRTPDVSHAVLQFDKDAAGNVASARVLDVSSGYFEWEEVAEQIAAAARAQRPLRVPHGWRGLSVTLDVTSEMRTASGARASSNVFDNVVGAVQDPLGAATRTPLQRVVAARMVDATVF